MSKNYFLINWTSIHYFIHLIIMTFNLLSHYKNDNHIQNFLKLKVSGRCAFRGRSRIISHFINYCYNSDIKISFPGFKVELILSCMFHIQMHLKNVYEKHFSSRKVD